MRRALFLASAFAVAVARPALADEPPPARGPIFGAAPDAPAPAAAAPAAVRLEYAAPEGCPDERELRSIVASSMGYDPFVSAAAPPGPTLRARIARQAGGFAGAIELRDPAGRVLWARPPLVDPDCRRLVSVLGTISIRAAVDTAPPTPPQPEPTAPPPIDRTAPPPEASPAGSRPAVRIGARGGLLVGMVHRPAAAFTGDVGVGWQYFSLNLEGLASLPVTGNVDSGVNLRSSIFAGSIVPCGHYGWFVGCGLVSVGAFQAEGVNVTSPSRSTGIYLGAGLRAALEWPIVPALALRLSGDVLANLHPLAPQVLIGKTQASATPVEVWRSGPFAAVLGAGIVLRFGGGPAPAKAAARSASRAPEGN